MAGQGLDVVFVVPPPADLTNGNRVTALRWADVVRGLGHDARVVHDYAGEACDVLVALHAVKSYGAAAAFRARYPDRPLIVALTGTDVYGDGDIAPALALATRVVVLQRHAQTLVPAATVIYQSAAPVAAVTKPDGEFRVAVVGHLRAIKDPFRAADAVRTLPATSRIRVHHAGRALTEAMAERAAAEAGDNPRYVWHGEMSPGATRDLIAGSHLVAITSRAEGSSNVLSEALASGVPVVASRAAGLLGTLGDGYPGLFPVGDTDALGALLARAETDAAFYESLRAAGAELADLVSPERERAAWAALLEGLP